MRLTNPSRFWTAFFFAQAGFLPLAIVGVWLYSGVLPSELLAEGSPLRSTSLFLFSIAALAMLIAAVLFSVLTLSKAIRLYIFFVAVAVVITSFFFAQVVMIPWLFPAWYAWKFYYGTNA